MIIDDEKIIVGSYNFTYAAKYCDAKNLLIINDPQLTYYYSDNWKKR